MSDIEKVCKFLEESGTYYLATVDGDQPRVRPFGTVMVFEGKLYIQTGKVKPVSRQLAANPKAEIPAVFWTNVGAPFEHASMHVIEAPGVRQLLAHRLNT